MKNTILKPRTTKFVFETVEQRRLALERLLADVHNRITEPDLSVMDATRLYNVFLSGTKLIHDMQSDSSLEDLDKRLKEIEAEYRQVRGKL